jgi:hypothetical protein
MMTIFLLLAGLNTPACYPPTHARSLEVRIHWVKFIGEFVQFVYSVCAVVLQ